MVADEKEEVINQMQVDIDQQCSQIIAKRQPAAIDLRMILTVTKIVNDLEQGRRRNEEDREESGAGGANPAARRKCATSTLAPQPGRAQRR